MVGMRDFTRRGFESKLRSWITRKLTVDDFAFERVLTDAVALAQIPHPQIVPDSDWWIRLCRACGEKSCSHLGSVELRQKLVHSLSQRLAVEEMFRLNGHEIEKEVVSEPYFVIGLPRSSGHYVTHIMSRSGLFLSPRMRDTYAPSLVLESERETSFNLFSSRFRRMYPDFRCVRVLENDVVDDDLSLNLHTPFSYAWGLLHGLDEYLLTCIQEDQRPVFEYTKRILQLFQWYRRCGHYSDGVKLEFNTIDNALELQQSGPKPVLTKMPWIVHSPLALLNSSTLHTVFPDMNIIWVHRALASCVPSLCSALSIHNTLYTGKKPTETALAQTGEKVLGIFGSGTENAIDYFSSFDPKRMVHISNRDANRHGARLMVKTMTHFNLEIDRHRRIQGINGQVEYQGTTRPLHDSQLQYFGLNEGVIGHVFGAYINQFEEFAFEKKFGIKVQDYQSLTSTNEEQLMSRRFQGSGAGKTVNFGEGQPSGGHFLAEGKHWN